MKTVSAAICSLENLKKAALYTVTSQFARFTCMLLSVIFDVEAINAATILLLGMIFDFAAVLVLSFGKERTRLPDGDVARRKAPAQREMMLRVGSVTVNAATGGVVEHDVASFPDQRVDPGVDLRVTGGQAVFSTGMDRRDAGAGLSARDDVLSDLLRGDREVGKLVLGGHAAGGGNGDDDLAVAERGVLCHCLAP